MSQKIVVIGKNGLLGSALAEARTGDFDLRAFGHDEIDICNLDQVREVLGRENPDIILHAVAMAKTEECEKRSEEAIRINALGALNVAKVSRELGARTVYISTDYVFDGQKDFYSENGSPNPLNVYGVTKYSGELFTKNFNPNHLIIRTSSLFGSGRGQKTDFVDLMLRLASEKKNIEVVDDIIMSPTYIISLRKKIFELLEKKAPSGIYHLSNSGACSWFEFAQKIFEYAKLDYPVKAIKASEQKVLATRPRRTELRSTKLADLGIEDLLDWQEDLKHYVQTKK